jgi:hypothetical protein
MSSGGWYDAPSGQRDQVMTQLQGAKLTMAQLQDADLHGVQLQDATLTRGQLLQAELSGAHLQRATLTQAHLEGADLRFAFLDNATILNGVQFGAPGKSFAKLADVRWGGANLTVVDWSQGIARGLGDERDARRSWPPIRQTPAGERPRLRRAPTRLRAFQTAARANRQLAAVMREQGMSEEADRFAYRGQVCQRVVYRREGRLLRFGGSLVLDLIAGYGYRPLRSLVTYLLVILGFAGLYLLNAQFAAPHLTWDEALVLSVSSFHGRGFFSSGIALSDTLARLAAGEAVLGLLIEITFIATFTQRFFAR